MSWYLYTLGTITTIKFVNVSIPSQSQPLFCACGKNCYENIPPEHIFFIRSVAQGYPRSQTLKCTQVTWGSCYQCRLKSVGLGRGLRLCMSSKLPDGINAAYVTACISKWILKLFLIHMNLAYKLACNSTGREHGSEWNPIRRACPQPTYTTVLDHKGTISVIQTSLSR